MSTETSAWAKEQRCGDPVTKAILVEIANWAKPTGYCEFLSIKRLAEVTEVSERTVQRHIRRLESEDAEVGGLALIRRVVRHREDGGQGANSFELVGYAPPTATGAPPRQSVTPRCQSVTGPRQNDGEPGDTRVTRLGDKIDPPSPSNDGDTPAADFDDGRDGEGARPAGVELPPPPVKVKPHTLPEDWQPSPVDDLPPMARDLVRQWPGGAYEAVSECFRLHFLAETRASGRKSDWRSAHGKWLINDHPKVMRDMKAGVSFAALAPRPAGSPKVTLSPPTPAKSLENDWSKGVHAILKRDLGESTWARQFEPCALLMMDDDRGIGLTLVAPSDFQRGYIEQQFRPALEQAVSGLTGARPAWVRFEVQRPGKEGGE